ncbi:MAG: type II toxin-antitoxin system YafQ family toxin [Spirochaetales bacterium]|nr:type II toxin-antitoxin system YafQ family toxin [Spirochaetales bacterium]
MYQLYYTNRMKRDVKLMKKRGKNIQKLIDILDKLIMGESLPVKNHDHQLTGNLKDFRECHIEPDWLLMYQISDSELILTATATGSHADLLGM